ncbi:oligosaccharide flippase family protein [Desulfofustis glycolicus]|nr:MATE family efflux transporter [Desulfofustis glycolicus]
MVTNTTATYARSILAGGLALFSSRWVLNSLGATDFGLFNVVGSLIVFLMVFNEVMASSASRHFAYAIGQGDINEIHKWFNASLCIHLFLPCVLIAIGWPIAEYVVRNVLNIPPARIDACVLVFRISLISAFVNMVAIPFVAMFNAKQRIVEIAFWTLLHAVLAFILAWKLTSVTYDRLIFYAVGMVAIHFVITSIKISRAIIIFKECRLQLGMWLDKRRFKELLSFATWTSIGRSGGTLRNQGSGILINLYFGPTTNAAYGIANQVSVQAAALSAAMMGAISPELSAREGRGQRLRMLDLATRTCRFGTLLVMVFAIPFIMEVDYILQLWLVNPPKYASALSQLMIVTFIVDKLSAGYMLAVHASGKIIGYQATVGIVLLMTLPLVWLFLTLGLPPASVGIAFVIVQVFCSIGRVIWFRILFEVPLRTWLKKVVLPCLNVATLVFFVTAVSRLTLSPSLTRLLLVCTTGFATMILSSWLFALSKDERKYIITLFRNVVA